MKMKKRICLPVLLFVLLSCPVLAIWHLDSQSVTVDLKISSDVDIVRGAGSSLDYVTANVSFVPKEEESQLVLKIDAEPSYRVVGGDYVFRWDSPVPANPGFEIDTVVKTKNVFNPVRKIPFPYLGFSDDVMQYTRPTKTIDSDDLKVIEKASELAAGETDYYAVVFKMADWTKETVKYDLSTLNVKASRKASYVLAHKDGVCDEITTLFLALLRAVGIPGRFISGIAYTESKEFPKNWGAHGWAEVYFPGTGWVPFDVTYGEYGYVDPTHIKLKESLDSSETDVSYEWLGHGIELSTSPLVVDANLIEHKGVVPDVLELKVSPVQQQVGIGSYNLVEATVRNRIDSYVSAFIFIARINELDIDGNNYRSIMLKPLETKKVYWLVKVIDSLPSEYTYTFPITVADMRNTSADSAFFVVPGSTVFSREEMESIVDAAGKEEEKVFSKRVEVNCSREKETYYVYDSIKISCVARNTGNFPFKSLDFCFSDTCKVADLGISQEKSFDYVLEKPKAGVNKVKFSIEGKEVSKSFFYDVSVLDEPKISIDDLEFPANIAFDKPYSVSFTLKKISASMPNDVKVDFDATGLKNSADVEELKVDRKLIFNMNSRDLSLKPNLFVISVSYHDINGKLYTVKEDFEISLSDVTFGQRMVIWLHDADRWLRNLFK